SSPFLFIYSTHLPLRPTPFPYTTLFRSSPSPAAPARPDTRLTYPCRAMSKLWPLVQRTAPSPPVRTPSQCGHRRAASTGSGSARSEEHTSELQSRENLVCRLLLEKKKQT